MACESTYQQRLEQQLAQAKDLNAALARQVAQSSAEAERRTGQLRQLAIELTQAEQRERERLAQVLHDHLQQLLVGAKIRLNALQIGLKNHPLHGSTRQVQELLDESIAVSRSLTVELSPPILHEPDFGRVLHWLAGWMKDKYGLHVQVQTDPRVHLPSREIRLLLLRAVRELLFNVVKHGGTDQALVTMTRGEDQVQVLVADPGRGFDLAGWLADRVAGGFGLSSLRERLALLGGQVRIDSRPGHGTQVTLVVPTGTGSSLAAAPGSA